MKLKAVLLLLPLLCFSLIAEAPAQKPDWIESIPYDEDFFFGVGKGSSEGIARNRALTDIKMQLATKVNSVIVLEQGEGAAEFRETIDFAVNSNSLRGAEEVDSYFDEDSFWLLLRYCDECSSILANSILLTLEGDDGAGKIDAAALMEEFVREENSKAVKLERMLMGLDLEEFNTGDIRVTKEGDSLVVRVSRFLPDSKELTERQKEGLLVLGDSLFRGLTSLGYTHVDITGHANPTGKAGEGEELDELSRLRAETMKENLSRAGLTVSRISWEGGKNPLGDGSTEEGKALNRRVDIVIHIEEKS